MRKMIWIGVALVALAGTGAYVAARHAAKHPDCFLARCANLAGYVGARCGALLSFNQTTNTPAKPVAKAPACDEQATINQLLDSSIADPAREPIEPIIVETIDPGLVPAKREPAANLESASAAEVETKAPFMPYADEGNPRTVRSASQTLVEMGWDLLTGWMPTSPTQAVRPADCFVRMSVQPFQEFVKTLHQETAEDIQTRVEEIPASHSTQADPVQPPALFPQLMVDPHHHHHYPSCPYTGRCPAPLPSTPRLGNIETPRSPATSPVPRNEAAPDLFLFWHGLFR